MPSHNRAPLTAPIAVLTTPGAFLFVPKGIREHARDHPRRRGRRYRAEARTKCDAKVALLLIRHCGTIALIFMPVGLY